MKYQIANPFAFPLSGEQRSVYEAIMAGLSVAVDACAGSGKSHTARATAKNYCRDIDSICFSRSLSDAEIETYKGFNHINSLNFHRRGLRLCGNVEVSKSNIGKVYDIALKIEPEKAMAIADLTICLKKEGVGIWERALSPEQVAIKYDYKIELAPLAVECLAKSDADKSLVDFEDMLRFPVLAKRVSLCPGLVILDEVQDFTPSSYVFLTECLTKPTTQVLMIGDPSRQCLQAFAGASAEIFAIMAEHFNCASMALTVNRRCSKRVVDNAPFKGDMVALDDAPEGDVGTKPSAEVISDIESGGFATDALLCETNAPLVKFGISLLLKGVKIQMRMAKLSGALFGVYRKFSDTRKFKIGTIAENCRKELDELAQTGEDVSDKKDLVECIEMLEMYCLAKGLVKTTFMNRKPCHPIQQALGLMVNSQAGITLMTGHTSKGLEWNTVFYLPASVKPPKQEWQAKQAECVAHVIGTRAKLNFYTLN